ncbi:MAG: SufD family Fe-S cluster assembly protein [Candidatus Moraniibacteriota bacterium]
MQYRDISTDTQTVYRLAANEKMVFFMLNRTGDITIELAGSGATAHVFALYSGKGTLKQSLTLTQKHLAPDTISSVLIKSALDDQSSFTYDGAIKIAPDAHRSDASQESRALILSPDARAYARPALEILAHDVSCHHAAATSPINAEALYFAQSRGLSAAKARDLLVQGFFQEAIEKMQTLCVNFQFPIHNVQTMFNESISELQH